jgi:YcaO-like protein with predicted kinase domain
MLLDRNRQGVTFEKIRGKLLRHPAIQYRGRALTQEKTFTFGTHRSRSPGETLARIRPHFKEIGLTRLADITGLDRIGIPTVLAIRPNGKTLSQFTGKGFTREAAIVSAVMECAETFYAENTQLHREYLPYENLTEERSALAVEDLPLSKGSIFSRSFPEYWSAGWDIIGQLEIWVPTKTVVLERTVFWHTGFNNFYQSSNGLASGNDLLEAITAGVYEVIERDALACHCYANIRFNHSIPRVIPESIHFPLALELLDQLRFARIGCIIYDCTVDTGVPVYMAFIYDQISRHIGIFKGFGAHLDPEIALIRAITEAVQARVVYISGSRDDLFRDGFTKLKQMDDSERIRCYEATPPSISLTGKLSEATKSFEGDLATCIGNLRRAGFSQIIVLDLTPPDVPVSIVRVLIPGLEGYMFLDDWSPGKRALTYFGEKTQ